ncbi:uncharacterized protein BJX67DRAFT_341973 [Aspergillus lucknowensis]|uniref:Uncharacterized protein n=1 Tax=Aspergillus lucknowensis TaxID=176173 RepID=A0ABR4M417_9EURO
MVLDHFTAPILTSTEAPPQPGHMRPGISPNKPREATPLADPNVPDPRLNINRPCIYERRLPGNAFITAHVQRLQHGYYSTPAVSDTDFEHVDFLAVSCVFHSPDTMKHRFKAATIRASVYTPHQTSSSRERSSRTSRPRSRNGVPTRPHFLMHAPHLLYGSLSPETLQWNYSLSGSLGIAQLPLIASLNPAAGLNGRYRRYEMMRIQGSVRTRGNVPASQIVWTLEENTLQRSGLPREFTFAVLIAQPGPDRGPRTRTRRVVFDLEIEPVLQSWFGAYPQWWLELWKRYRAVKKRRRGVDFRTSVGQRFGPVASSRRGFNFAALGGEFESFVALSGRRATSNTVPAGDPQDGMDTMPFPPLPQPNSNPMSMPMPVPVPYAGLQNPGGVQVTIPIGPGSEPRSRPRERLPSLGGDLQSSARTSKPTGTYSGSSRRDSSTGRNEPRHRH